MNPKEDVKHLIILYSCGLSVQRRDWMSVYVFFHMEDRLPTTVLDVHGVAALTPTCHLVIKDLLSTTLAGSSLRSLLGSTRTVKGHVSTITPNLLLHFLLS